jgi:hypothetical protein
MIEVYRAMTSGQRVEAGLSATDLVRARIRAHLAQQNPHTNAPDLEAAVARRLLGERG